MQLTALDVDGVPKTITLNNVMFLPQVCYNLLSVPTLVARGSTFIDSPEGANLHTPQGIIFPLHRIGSLLHLKQVSSPVAPVAVRDTALVVSDINLWHRRLGHLNYDDVQTVLRQHDIPASSKHKSFCESCVMAKSQRAAASKEAIQRQTAPKDLVFTDLNGPMDTSPVGFPGTKYVVIFVDDCTRFAVLYFLKTKDEVLDAFREFCGTVFAPKVLQCDNDSVYRSKAFQGLCTTQGITLRYSAPYCQYQNGIAERSWRTLLEASRALLHSAQLPTSFWAFAMAHANYIRNRVPTSHLHLEQSDNPFEAMFGIQPEILHLREFGCSAYVHVADSQRTKWQSKARRGIYVGRNGKSKTDLIYFKDTHTVVESAHVIYDESTTTSPSVTSSQSVGDAAPSVVPVPVPVTAQPPATVSEERENLTTSVKPYFVERDVLGGTGHNYDSAIIMISCKKSRCRACFLPLRICQK